MNITEQVKQLIANGKTQEAIEWLQHILKDKDTNLLNQTYLLEGQYKDLVKKMQLGLQDTITDVNRINFALLNLCDEIDKASIKTPKLSSDYEQTISVEDTKHTSNIALIAFVIITFLVIAIVIALIYVSKK